MGTKFPKELLLVRTGMVPDDGVVINDKENSAVSLALLDFLYLREVECTGRVCAHMQTKCEGVEIYLTDCLLVKSKFLTE